MTTVKPIITCICSDWKPKEAKNFRPAESLSAAQFLEKFTTINELLKTKLEASPLFIENQITVTNMGNPRRVILGGITRGIVIENILLSNGVKMKLTGGYYESLSGNGDEAPFFEYNQPTIIGTQYDNFGSIINPGYCSSKTHISTTIDVVNQKSEFNLFSIELTKAEAAKYNLNDLRP